MKWLITKVEVILSKGMEYARVDGEMHIIIMIILLCIFGNLFNIQTGLAVAGIIAIAREIYNISCNGETYKEALHDLICDAAGIVLGVIIFYSKYLNLL